MNAPQLILPDVRFKESYLSALSEYHSEKRFLEDKEDEITKDFSAYVEKEKSKARGENLPAG